MSLPYRLATYKYKLQLPSPPDGPPGPVEWNFCHKVNLCSSEKELKDDAKLFLLEWLDKHLEIEVETKRVGERREE
jgi:hypothetical protein